jgi:hypothetical protein
LIRSIEAKVEQDPVSKNKADIVVILATQEPGIGGLQSEPGSRQKPENFSEK